MTTPNNKPVVSPIIAKKQKAVLSAGEKARRAIMRAPRGVDQHDYDAMMTKYETRYAQD